MKHLTVDFTKHREWWKYLAVIVIAFIVGQTTVGIDSNLLLVLMLIPFW